MSRVLQLSRDDPLLMNWGVIATQGNVQPDSDSNSGSQDDHRDPPPSACDDRLRGGEMPRAKRTATCACKPSPMVFWLVAVVSWLTFWPVVVLITLGNDWLREDEGERLDWFKPGGTSEFLRSCESDDDDVLSDELCDKFMAFSVIQAAASLIFAVAALMLVIALCWATPRPWGIAAGTLLMLVTIMQAVVVVLVSMIKVDIDDASASADSSGSVTTSDSVLSVTASASTNEQTFLPLPEVLEYGMTFYLALYGAIVTFNESLLLCALADYSGKGPLHGLLCCKACKLTEIGYTPPSGMFEMPNPSAAPVYPVKVHPHSPSP